MICSWCKRFLCMGSISVKERVKSFIRFELRLIGVLSFIFSMLTVIQHVQQDIYPQKVFEVRQTPAPEGRVYLDYCDGRPSEHLAPKTEAGCLADYPTDSAFTFALASSTLIFVLLSLGAALFHLVSHCSARRKGRSR